MKLGNATFRFNLTPRSGDDPCNRWTITWASVVNADGERRLLPNPANGPWSYCIESTGREDYSVIAHGPAGLGGVTTTARSLAEARRILAREYVAAALRVEAFRTLASMGCAAPVVTIGGDLHPLKRGGRR